MGRILGDSFFNLLPPMWFLNQDIFPHISEFSVNSKLLVEALRKELQLSLWLKFHNNYTLSSGWGTFKKYLNQSKTILGIEHSSGVLAVENFISSKGKNQIVESLEVNKISVMSVTSKDRVGVCVSSGSVFKDLCPGDTVYFSNI